MISYVLFDRPVHCPPSHTLSNWSANQQGALIHIEEDARGVVLLPGKRVGPDKWEPTGHRVLVPWANILTLIEAPSSGALSTEKVAEAFRTTNARARREVKEVADGE